jgi:hypothetical protein
MKTIAARIGPTFAADLAAASLRDGIAWTSTGVMIPDDFDPALRAQLDAVIAAHDPSKPAPTVTVLAKVDLYRRLTDAEFDAMTAGVAAQSKRVQGIFDAAQNFRSDAPEWELLTRMAVQLYGETRTAELLTPPAA